MKNETAENKKSRKNDAYDATKTNETGEPIPGMSNNSANIDTTHDL